MWKCYSTYESETRLGYRNKSVHEALLISFAEWIVPHKQILESIFVVTSILHTLDDFRIKLWNKVKRPALRVNACVVLTRISNESHQMGSKVTRPRLLAHKWRRYENKALNSLTKKRFFQQVSKIDRKNHRYTDEL